MPIYIHARACIVCPGDVEWIERAKVAMEFFATRLVSCFIFSENCWEMLDRVKFYVHILTFIETCYEYITYVVGNVMKFHWQCNEQTADVYALIEKF